ITSLERVINPRNPQHAFKRYEAYGSSTHATTDHYDIKWFKRGEALQAKKAEALKSTRAESSNANKSTTPTKRATGNLNWLWYKRLAHLNFKTINQLAKQNLVIGLPSLVYSKDKPCSSCEKVKHHRANFKTKQTFSIKNCLHLIYMDLFGPVTPRSINHEKYSLVIVDEYSRTDNGTKGIAFLSASVMKKRYPKTFPLHTHLNKMGLLKGKIETLIEFARTMLSGSIFLKQYWNEVVATASYTQNRYTIVKGHLKTPYEIFRGKIPNINFLHVFGCPIYIHKHKDYLGKFNEKVNDGYFLGYSLVSKVFRVFNTRKKQTKETYHITFDESTNAIKFLIPSVNNINIVESERYPPDEYIHHYEPYQKYQVNINEVSFIDSYERSDPIVLETKASSD
ncbi:retrovirus-related pol polyprotein from transposon TNT 1-94, partial [Tanacetum coccineum]